MKPQPTEPVEVTQADMDAAVEIVLTVNSSLKYSAVLVTNRVASLLAAHRVAAEWAALLRAADWCEHQTGDFAQFFTPKSAADTMRAMAGIGIDISTVPLTGAMGCCTTCGGTGRAVPDPQTGEK